ncbi:MAG: hypothetical protein ACRDQ2_09125 [Gaiellales bacterium]
MLILAGYLSLGVAVLHLAIIVVGPPGYRYFGAGEEIARMAEAGSPLPAVLTLGLAAIFGLWGFYAFSGAGLLPRWPLLRTALVLIGSIYLLRGLLLVPQIVAVGPGGFKLHKEIMFSLVSLVIGVIYMIGVVRSWRRLSAGATRGIA